MSKVKYFFLNIYVLSGIIFSVLSSVLIFSWFRYGFLYGGGDVGLPSYDAKRIFDIVKYIWWEASAPGTTVPQGLTSVPLEFVQSVIQQAGLSFVITQAILFWILLFLMGYGMFLVGLSVFDKNRKLLSVLAGLFYMLNPFMMIQVWHRFVHTTLFLAAALPFIFLFWRKWIQSGKLVFLLGFLIVNFFGAYLYGTFAFLVTIFIFLLLISLYEIFFPWENVKKAGLITLRLSAGLIFLILTNVWWMIPSFLVAPALLSTQHSAGDSVSTLLAISQQAIIPYSILGINPFYLYFQEEWGQIYASPFFRIIPWFSLVLIIPGFIEALKRKKWLFWAFLALIGVFLAKGSADPFGYLYLFSLSNFFPLGVLRNPFEKLGIFLPFAFAILGTLGIGWYLNISKKKIKILTFPVLILITFLLLGVNLWPMWAGKLFGRLDNPAFVKIPDSYKQTDDFIKGFNKDGKILHLPLTTGEAVTYNWGYGYNGVEPSQLLFKTLPSISHGFNIYSTDDALSALSQVFNLNPIKEDKVLELLQVFNIRFLVLHKDMEWRGGYLTDPKKMEEILNSFKFITKRGEFGDLDVYEVNDDVYRQRIYYTGDPYYIVLGKDNSYWPWLIKNSNGDIIYNVNKTEPQTPYKGFIVLPNNVYLNIPYENFTENVLDELPAVKFLPDSFFYPFIKLKEKVLLFIMPETEKFQFRMTIAGKRIAEAYKVKQKNLNIPILSILSDYNSGLPELKSGILARKGLGLANGQIPLESIFAKHLKVLEMIKVKINSDDELGAIEDTNNLLIETLKESNIMPFFKVLEADGLPVFGRQIFKFDVPKSGSYELLQAQQGSKDVYPNKLSKLNFQIDNTVKSLDSNLDDVFLSFGKINFDKSIHEVSIGYQVSQNLINDTTDLIKKENITIDGNEIVIESAQHDASSVEYQIKPITGGGWYQLSFDSWIKLGNTFKVRLTQDSDPVDPSNKEEKLYSFNKTYFREAYNNYWNKYTVNLNIKPATQKASIELIVEPWDNCADVLVKKILCNIKRIRTPFERSSASVFKNITIQRQLKNPIFLRSDSNTDDSKNIIDMVVFSQKSPVLYSGMLSVKKPGYLIFSETYHPGWRLELTGDKQTKVLSPSLIANLYSNAWYIDKAGSYKFKLFFEPQNLVGKAVLITAVSYSLIIILVVWQFIQRKNRNTKKNKL